MLLQFNVTNCFSFKNETKLSLRASADRTYKERLITSSKKEILPSVAIYGANAAGKSNLFKALETAIRFVKQSNTYQINNSTSVVPFLFDDDSEKQLTKFDFSFVYNNIQYDYGFSCNQKVVYDEFLYEYKSQKPSLIFERTEINQYHYATLNRKELSQYEDKTLPNKLFLATATAWNCTLTKNAFLWFAEYIDVFNPQISLNTFIKSLREDNSEETKSFMMDFIYHADLNISDYSFRADKAEHTQLDIVHNVEINNQIRSFSIPISAESNGTMRVFAYGPLIMNALKYGKTLVIDEIDSSLHPILVRYIIDLFNDSKINQNGAQLIFNTHDVSLLDQDIFRRDQIYFVEKDNKTGISDLYSLSDFSPRKSEDIRKGYLQGRYGAIPAIIPGALEW